MAAQRLQQSAWTSVERKCLYLLQQKGHTRASILQIHAFMLVNALEANVNLLTKFISCCSFGDPVGGTGYARQVFDQRPHRDDTFLCNSMIKAHVGAGEFYESVLLYKDLRQETGFLPDNFTYTALAKSCSLSMFRREGLQLQNHAFKIGFWLDLYVSTAFVDVYAKWGSIDCARMLFEEMPERSLVSWTVLIGGYVRYGDICNAQKLFDDMPEKDTAAYNLMIDAYVKLGEMDKAQSLFDQVPEPNVVSWTSMLYGYCLSGDIQSSRSMFDAMPHKNLHSWNVMISGYCQNKQPHKAVELFHDILQSSTSIKPDGVTLVSVLPAIADLGALDLGNWVHQYVRKEKLDRSSIVRTALVDMFAKCGDIDRAKGIFDRIQDRNVISWNAMIHGFAVNGASKKALEVFLDMQHQGVLPNEVTMLGVLSACNHGGLVEEGKRWFRAMETFKLKPEIEHYGCMVDLLGRAGLLEEAENLIANMPYKVNEIILSSFLFACGYLKDAARVERVMRNTTNTTLWNDGNYVILRNLYAAERRWGDAEEIKSLMRKNGASKEVGCSVIEIDGDVREFVAGDRKNPKWKIIPSTLNQLFMHMQGLATQEGIMLSH